MRARNAVRVIDAAESRDLRQRVLRPSQSVRDLETSDDEHATYLGVFANGSLAACASISHEPPPGSQHPGAWRLRGMAAEPEVRGQGYGSQALLAAIAEARGSGGDVLWCNARTPARRFYERHGFVAHGEEFLLPDAGPHFLMSRPL